MYMGQQKATTNRTHKLCMINWVTAHLKGMVVVVADETEDPDPVLITELVGHVMEALLSQRPVIHEICSVLSSYTFQKHFFLSLSTLYNKLLSLITVLEEVKVINGVDVRRFLREMLMVGQRTTHQTAGIVA